MARRPAARRGEARPAGGQRPGPGVLRLSFGKSGAVLGAFGQSCWRSWWNAITWSRTREGHYAFAHAIMQGRLLRSILKERRAHYHRLVSRLWELHRRRLPRPSADARRRTAYWAREGARGGPELARRFGGRDGFSGDKSVLFLQRHGAVELGGSSRERPGAPQARRRLQLGLRAGPLLACYLEALDLLQDEPAQVVELYRKIATVYNIRGEPRRAEDVRQSGRSAGRQTRDPPLAGPLLRVATAFFRSGRDEDAKAWILRIMEQYKKEGRRLPVPEDADIYRLMPAFSDLVKPP